MRRTEFNTQWTPMRRSGNTQDFLRRRLSNFGISMLVMGICFPLYYLGFFGSVGGPLNPDQLGERLASMGVSKTHILVFFLSFLIIAVTWNWIYNLASLMIGSQMTCIKKIDDEGTQCGAPVTRKKFENKKTGVMVHQYLCAHGHKRPEAHFHHVKKGALSHSLWVVSLFFCIIVFYLS